MVDGRTATLDRATVGDVQWLGLAVEDAFADLADVSSLSRLVAESNPCPLMYVELLERKAGVIVDADDLPGWALFPFVGSSVVHHWQSAPLNPWAAAAPATTGGESFATSGGKKDERVPIDPSHLTGVLGDLALLYRMMTMLKYRIPDVNRMLVVECAVALGVDQTHHPAGLDAETVAAARPDPAALMLQPSEVMVVDPDMLLGRLGVAATTPNQ